jgi:hypothetical protein
METGERSQGNLEKTEPQVTISVVQLHHFWLISSFFAHFPEESFALSSFR